MKARIASLLTAISIVALASCVELTGQRISLRYDEGRDELQILICHDGIHESPPSRNDEGPKQIPEYVANGDLLLLDWPGSIQMKELRAEAENAALEPARRALAAAVVASLRSSPVGWYRDPDGRLGAVQYLVISKAKDLLAKANALINAEVLRRPSSTGSEWSATLDRMREGARQGRSWLTIEGHSLVFRFPAHPAEWARAKAAYVKVVLDGLQETKEGRGNDNRPGFFLQLLALAPLSLQESSEGVAIRLGDPKRPVPMRFSMRDAYNDRLEKSVMAAAPADVDEALARSLLRPEGEKEGKVEPGIEALLAWGPPEDAARTLLAKATSADPAVRTNAITRLRALGESWNQAGSQPPAPAFSERTEGYLAEWRQWYRGVLAFPTGE